MPYTINVGDFIEIQNVYTYNGQTFRNVWHFKVTAGPSQSNGSAFLQSLIGYWDANFWDELRLLLSSDVTLQFITAQVVKPSRYRLETALPTTPEGALAQTAVPPTTAVDVKRWAQRSGRKYQGRIYIPGLPQGHHDKGVLTPAVATNWDNANEIFNLAPVVSGTTLKQYLNVQGTDVNLQEVVGTFTDPILRVQRRREIGKGE